MIEGWTAVVQEFDSGTKWGVAIERSQHGRLRRYSIRLPSDDLTCGQAVDLAMPKLLEWANERQRPAAA